jgi:hypothetical protein
VQHWEIFQPLMTLAAVVVFQGSLFLIWRMLIRPAAPSGTHLATSAPHSAAAPPRKVEAVDPARAAVLGRVAGPGIGLMITGLLGFLPVVLALLAIPAWTLTPIQSGPSYREPLEFLDGLAPLLSPPSGFLPIISSPLAPGTLSISGSVPSAPLLVAQTGPPIVLWVIFASLLFILNLAFSVTLIIGGWRMRQLKSYGLAVIAAVLAMLPCTFGWFIGLPMGIWAFSILAKNEVRDAFES